MKNNSTLKLGHKVFLGLFAAFSLTVDAQSIPDDGLNTPDIQISDGNFGQFSQTENSVFISPLNKNIILNSNVTRDNPVTATYPSSFFYSTNGGSSWSGTLMGPYGGPGFALGDPAAAIGIVSGQERFYMNAVGYDFGQTLSYSDDYGVNWNFVNIVTNPFPWVPCGPSSICPNTNYTADKNHFWVDNSSASSYFGNLYCAWTELRWQSPNTNHKHILFSKSNNSNPSSWSTPVAISTSTASFNQGVNIQTGRKGEVYACWAIYDGANWAYDDEDAIGFTKSMDGGATWSAVTRIQNINGIKNTGIAGPGYKQARQNSFPSMTVNKQTGEIYIVWTELIASGPFGPETDINFTKYDPVTNTWSSKQRVNQDNSNINAVDQWMPWIACDEVTGALAVIYYDSRDVSFGTNDFVDTYVSISTDGANNWSDYRMTDWGETWNGNGVGGSGGNYAGDYLGIDVFKGKVVPMWTDNRWSSGTHLSYTQPFDIPCPNNLSICNGTIAGSSTLKGEAMYRVNNSIAIGGAGCKYLVDNNGKAVMEAGSSITLNQGFHAIGNCTMEIKPGCSTFAQRTQTTNEENTKRKNSLKNVTAKNENISDLMAYPNPTIGKFKLLLLNKEEFPIGITVEDSFGKTILVVNEPRNHVHDLNLENAPEGMYIIKVIYPNRVSTQKIVKQN